MNPLAAKFSRLAFLEWLESADPEAQVGLRRCGARCPVAEFVNAQGFRVICVDYCSITAYEGPHEFGIMTPTWAQKFINRVDADQSTGRRIRAKEALAVLKEIRP